MATKVSLDSIQALTFYKDEYTQARRTSPIQQLTCIGKSCKQYQPEVVRCTNDGGKGLDVQWKCEADLPEKLRFGKVEVSCEGWNRPGDTKVLKGSCALEYRLVYVPDAFRDNHESLNYPHWLERMLPKDPYETVFMIIWSVISLFCLYLFIRSCFTNSTRWRRSGSNTNHRADGNDGGGGGGGGGGGWFPPNNSRPHSRDPPPPYSGPHSGKSSSENTSSRWRPGFWSGVGLGGIAASLWNSGRNQQLRAPDVPQRSTAWDWERPAGGWFRGSPAASYPPATSGGLWGRFGTGTGQMITSPARQTFTNEDRGEGSSSMGRLRTATGYGNTKTR